MEVKMKFTSCHHLPYLLKIRRKGKQTSCCDSSVSRSCERQSSSSLATNSRSGSSSSPRRTSSCSCRLSSFQLFTLISLAIVWKSSLGSYQLFLLSLSFCYCLHLMDFALNFNSKETCRRHSRCSSLFSYVLLSLSLSLSLSHSVSGYHSQYIQIVGKCVSLTARLLRIKLLTGAKRVRREKTEKERKRGSFSYNFPSFSLPLCR